MGKNAGSRGFPGHVYRGAEPFVVNINAITRANTNFRTALWTGDHLQLTLMCIGAGEEIGLEMHPDVDQFLCVQEGGGYVAMGNNQRRLACRSCLRENCAILIPAGTWHNVINSGKKPLKLYSIYAPPQHPRGTVHITREMAEEGEHPTPCV